MMVKVCRVLYRASLSHMIKRPALLALTHRIWALPDNRATDQALCEGFDDKTDKAGIAGADTLNTGGCSG